MHLKNKIIISKKLITLLSIFLCTLIILNTTKNKLFNVFNKYIENDIINTSTYIINKAIRENDFKNGVEVLKNDKGEIESVDFNDLEKTMVQINDSIIKELYNIESNLIRKEKNIYYIPYGMIDNNYLLAFLGPNIPLKVNVIGNIKSNIQTDITSYGINNVLIKIYLVVDLKMNVIMPFISENIENTINLPLVTKIINGSVPQMYGGAFSISKSID